MAFKLKSGNNLKGSSFKMMGSSSPAKRAANWITNDAGEKVQVSEQDILAHERDLESAHQKDADKKVADLSNKTSTTGQESLDKMKSKMSQKEKKIYAGLGDENYQAGKSAEWKKAYALAQKEKLEEEKSGVAANQKKLDRA